MVSSKCYGTSQGRGYKETKNKCDRMEKIKSKRGKRTKGARGGKEILGSREGTRGQKRKEQMCQQDEFECLIGRSETWCRPTGD